MRPMRCLALALIVPVAALAADAGAPPVKPAPKKAPVTAPAPVKPAAVSATPAAAAVPVKPAPVTATPAAVTPAIAASATQSGAAVPPPWMKPAAPAATMAETAVAPVAPGAGVEVPAAGAGLVVVPMGEAIAAKPIFTPLYGFTWSEGLNTSSVGSFFFGSNLDTTLGGRWALPNDQALCGVYELTYSGPALRAQEGREFAERSIDHSLGMGHQWKVSPQYLVRTRLSFLDEYRRSGSSELFGHGLYDFYAPGINVDQELDLGSGMLGGLGLSYTYVLFPNYTDLLTEFQQANATSEKAGGEQDYQQIRLNPSIRFGKQGSVWLALATQMYVKGTVIGANGTAGSTKQLDATEELGAAWIFGTPSEAMGLSSDPSLTVRAKQSNQNFLHFRYFGDLAPDFIHHNYNYWSVDLLAPGHWWFDDTRQLFLQPEFVFTQYTSRPPRTAAGLYKTDQRQYDSSLLLTLGYRKPIYRTGTLTTGYMLQLQASNNHFERFLPYNYTGNMLFTSVNITY